MQFLLGRVNFHCVKKEFIMMKSKKTLTTWLNEYGVSHQNPLNKKIHIVCVPIIFFDHRCHAVSAITDCAACG